MAAALSFPCRIVSPRALGTACIVFVGILSPAFAQTLPLVSVDSAYRDNTGAYTYSPILYPGAGSHMLDTNKAGGDSYQTGQPSADFLSSPTAAGFLVQHGQLANGTEIVAYRFIFDGWSKNGFNSTVRLGMDFDGDSAIDLYFGLSAAVGNTNQHGIYFQNPTGGLNVSPSTTSLTNNYGQIALTTGASANFDYQSVTLDGVARGMVTFAVPVQSLADALAAINSSFNFTADSFVRYIAFTATQQSANSINQDVFGTTNNGSSIVRYDAPGGGFSEYTNGSGAPIPEPSTYGILSISGFLGLLGIRRWRASRRQS